MDLALGMPHNVAMHPFLIFDMSMPMDFQERVYNFVGSNLFQYVFRCVDPTECIYK